MSARTSTTPPSPFLGKAPMGHWRPNLLFQTGSQGFGGLLPEGWGVGLLGGLVCTSDLMATHRLALPQPSQGSLCFPPLEGGTLRKLSSGRLTLCRALGTCLVWARLSVEAQTSAAAVLRAVTCPLQALALAFATEVLN